VKPLDGGVLRRGRARPPARGLTAAPFSPPAKRRDLRLLRLTAGGEKEWGLGFSGQSLRRGFIRPTRAHSRRISANSSDLTGRAGPGGRSRAAVAGRILGWATSLAAARLGNSDLFLFIFHCHGPWAGLGLDGCVPLPLLANID
jgi:hypothetical protein